VFMFCLKVFLDDADNDSKSFCGLAVNAELICQQRLETPIELSGKRGIKDTQNTAMNRLSFELRFRQSFAKIF